MTRTAALGEPDPALRRIADLVVAAQAEGVAAVRDGVAAGDVDAACRSRIAAAGFGDRFVHPTGHAVGLDVHEEPILRAGAAARLRRRMAVTVEPGVYVPGLGGVRVEDTVLVTDADADVLTRAPRELAVL
jgi:Xaa-Pro aminopeptidase